MCFEALEQTLRLRLVSGPVDKKFFFSWGIDCPVQYVGARAMHEFFFENLRNPARNRSAGLMLHFCPGQLNSIHRDTIYCINQHIPNSLKKLFISRS